MRNIVKFVRVINLPEGLIRKMDPVGGQTNTSIKKRVKTSFQSSTSVQFKYFLLSLQR